MHDVRIIPPPVGATPIRGPLIVPVVGLLELSRDRLVGVQGGTVLDLLFGQGDGDVARVADDSRQRIRGDQDLSLLEPVSRVGDQVADRPVVVIEVEVLDAPDVPVEAAQLGARERLGIVQHCAVPLSPEVMRSVPAIARRGRGPERIVGECGTADADRRAGQTEDRYDVTGLAGHFPSFERMKHDLVPTGEPACSAPPGPTRAPLEDARRCLHPAGQGGRRSPVRRCARP